MAKYCVTGGAGFIGSHLVDALIASGHQVDVIDNLSTGKRENLHPQATFHLGNIQDEALLAKVMHGIDGCFHLAAIASVTYSNEHWLESHDVNQTSTIKVFDVARSLGHKPPKIVYASSAAVYGDSTELPLKESTRVEPLTAYGADKYGCELHARVAYQVHQLSSVGCRFFNVFGPRQDPKSPYSGVISLFADRLKSKHALEIFGDGEQSRDFIYVADVVSALMAAMQLPEQGSFVVNVCRGESLTINQLAILMANTLSCSYEIEYKPSRAGDIRDSLGDPSQLKALLQFAAKYPISDGLALTLKA